MDAGGAEVWEDRTEHFSVRSPLLSVAGELSGVGRRIQTPVEREDTKGFEHRKRLARLGSQSVRKSTDS
jgi:hypothetical protein